ncbi:NKG2-F type II integral membrane protein-like, partial [Carlito syrichta]|uniref:NKG2-F type II integral membrane protein-like n=1 Tax=Carlito syrichta TaxID=1868482 RepID=A0A3Q0E2D2_CARSF
MKKQRRTYSQLNLSEDPKKQQKTPKVSECSISVTEQEKTHMKLNLQNVSLDHQEEDMTYQNKDLPSPPKKITAEILTIICIVLMASVLKTIVLIFSHNCSCPEEWFTYSNSCYYIGKETKIWEDSMMTCASMNSSLLYIDDEEEMVGEADPGQHNYTQKHLSHVDLSPPPEKLIAGILGIICLALIVTMVTIVIIL